MSIILIIVIVVIIIFLVGTVIHMYNNLVGLRNRVINSYAQIDVQLKRRNDLIPNLLETVKGYAAHESETLEGVVAARAKATQVTVDPADLTPEALARYNAAQGDLSSALGKLLMIQENYPDLKANQNFLDLQAQLEGTENRIATERMKFNDAVKAFNTGIRRFPDNIIASIFGFEKKGYFEAKDGADVAPVVEF